MTLNQILYFRRLPGWKIITRQQRNLYISQPSLSRSMAALESELGITLFEKKGRGVVLTNAGRLFLEHADRIAGDCDIATGKMREISPPVAAKSISVIFFHLPDIIFRTMSAPFWTKKKIKTLPLVSGRTIPLPLHRR